MSSNFSAFKIPLDHQIKPFKCSDTDLKGFLTDDAINNLRERISTTYIFENEFETIAYFSLLNDKISYKDTTNKEFEGVKSKLPQSKGIGSYPACKIGRLAVSENFQNLKIGSQIINYIKIQCIVNDFSACRFLTVDSYFSAIEFYNKHGFRKLPKKPSPDQKSPPVIINEVDNTQFMYFDLKTLIPTDSIIDIST